MASARGEGAGRRVGGARAARRGQTLFEMLFVIGMIVLAIGAGTLGRRAGHGFWLIAAEVVGGLLVLPVIGAVCGFIESRKYPRMPACARGRCRGWQWTTMKVIETKYIDPTKDARASVERCRCGDEYVRVGDRLLRFEGGMWRPFKRFVRRGEWVDDDDGSVLEPDVRGVVWERGRD
ncbi:MAG: hypothetical protein IT434_16110 [Phycisphaerales bacterium]|nr:hypothetical protein [Phycisphaerales bacterium]